VALQDAGAFPRLLPLLRMTSAPSVVAEASRAVGNLVFGNEGTKALARQAGCHSALVAALSLQHVQAVKSALVAVVNLVDQCADNQDAVIAGGVAPHLVRLLRVRGQEIVSRACYCVHALTHRHARAQQELAAAGAIPPLVRLLYNKDPDLVDKAVLAISSLVHGNRANQINTALAGGIAPLAALIEGHNHPQLSRHVVDAWIELGGMSALVKLLGHRHAPVVERAARRIIEMVVGPALAPAAVAAPAAPAAAAASSGTPPKGQQKGQKQLQTRRGGTQAAAEVLAATPSAPGSGGLPDSVPGLIKFGAPAALVKACRSRSQAVVEAGLDAVTALARCDQAARGQLVDAGAIGTLQLLMGSKVAGVSRRAAAASQALFVK